MERVIVSPRNEDAVAFLQCHCGNEIISVFYYKGTTTCPEIISMNYFGTIDPKYHRDRYFAFNQDTFEVFVTALDRCTKEGPYSFEIREYSRRLVLNKDATTRLTTIQVQVPYGTQRKLFRTIWDITVRNQELEQFIQHVKTILKKIQENNNVKIDYK